MKDIYVYNATVLDAICKCNKYLHVLRNTNTSGVINTPCS